MGWMGGGALLAIVEQGGTYPHKTPSVSFSLLFQSSSGECRLNSAVLRARRIA